MAACNCLHIPESLPSWGQKVRDFSFLQAATILPGYIWQMQPHSGSQSSRDGIFKLFFLTCVEVPFPVRVQCSEITLEHVEDSTSLCLYHLISWSSSVTQSYSDGLTAHIPFVQPYSELLWYNKRELGHKISSTSPSDQHKSQHLLPLTTCTPVAECRNWIKLQSSSSKAMPSDAHTEGGTAASRCWPSQPKSFHSGCSLWNSYINKTSSMDKVI